MNWKKWLGGAVSGLLVTVAAVLLTLTPSPPVPPAPGPGPDVSMPCPDGWRPDVAEEAVPEVLRHLPEPYFRGTPAFRATAEDAGDIFLWEAARQVTGDLLPPRDQGGVGSCVSFGTASAIEHLECIQIILGNLEEFRPLAQEVIYGGSRVQIGKGRIRGDGSVGAWAAQFVRDYGVVARGSYPGYDLLAYSESLCRSMGSKGCPSALEPIAKQTPVRAITLIQTVDEAKKALQNGYPIAVCSGQGFSAERDADGFAKPNKRWAHCMCVLGWQGGKRPGFYILNSWGLSYHKGPVGAGNPSPAGFWADEAVVGRMFAQKDSWAFSDLKGFPARKIHWWVMPRPVREKGEKPR